jgi:hypothetical protein|tara:strand:- start:9424 stop:9687 length:264 start_codon:yes stop_codon:yes gene_type:complete
MAERYDLKVVRKGKDGKSYSSKIGSAWPWRSGKDGFNLTFDALPMAQMRDDGTLSCDVMMAEPYKDDSQQPRRNPDPHAPLDDDIPF